MTLVTKARIQALAREAEEIPGPRVSLYLPCQPERGVNRLVLQRLVRQARSELTAGKLTSEMINSLMHPIERLVDETPFPVSKGNLAIFSSLDSYHEIQVPAPVPEIVKCGSKFLLEPLVEACGKLHQYFAIVLTARSVMLYFGDTTGLNPLALPESLERPVSHKPAVSGITAGYSRRKKDEASHRYLDNVTSGILNILKNRPAKVLLFGPARLTSRMESRFSHKHQVSAISGSSAHLSAGELHALAWPEVIRMASQSRQILLNRLEESSPSQCVKGLLDTLGAARQGQLSRLFVREGNEVQQRESCEEATLATLRYGGEVTVCPTESLTYPLAGVLRY